MNSGDVELVVTPASAMSQDEALTWIPIIAGALSKWGGKVRCVLAPRGERYAFVAFLWRTPGAWLLQRASDQVTTSMRAAVVEALRAAGKPIED